MKNCSTIRAIAFDAYGTLFDVYSVGALAEQLFPGFGDALTAQWRLKQIEYSFLRTLSGRYKPFLEVTEDGLVFSAKKLGLQLDDAKRRQLMNQYACLSPFPENLGVLKELRTLGIPMAILSNGTPGMLDVAIKNADLVAGVFNPEGRLAIPGHEEIEVGPCDVVSFPPGCLRRFQCVAAPAGETEAVMLFVIGGNAPAAAFSEKAYERIAEVPAPA